MRKALTNAYITYKERVGDLAGIAKLALCTMNIPTRNTNHGLILVFKKSTGAVLTKAEMLNDLDSIKVSLNDTQAGYVELVNNLVSDVLMMNSYRDAALSGFQALFDAGTAKAGLYIPFTRRRVPIDLPGGNINFAIGMQNVTAYQIQVKFANPATLNSATCEVYTVIDKGPSRPLGAHCRLSQRTRTQSTIGKEQVIDLPYGEAGTALLGYHVYQSTGTLDEVTVKHDGELVFDRLSDAVNRIDLNDMGRTPQTGFFHVDFTQLRRALPMEDVKSFWNEFSWITAAPNAYRVILDTVHGIQM